jgi:hypothetical protein
VASVGPPPPRDDEPKEHRQHDEAEHPCSDGASDPRADARDVSGYEDRSERDSDERAPG